MKDFLNFDITARPDGTGVSYTIKHRKRDLSLDFRSERAIQAQHVPDFLKGLIKAWTHKYFKATRGHLSKKQKAFYDALVWFHKEEGRPPSYQEMIDILGYKSKGTASVFVARLVEAGWLWKDEDGRVIPVDIAAPETTE